jgi:hypothetical protein
MMRRRLEVDRARSSRRDHLYAATTLSEVHESVVQGLGSTAGHIILGPDGGVFMGSLVGLQIYDGNFNLVKSAGMPTVAMPADPTAFCAALSA